MKSDLGACGRGKLECDLLLLSQYGLDASVSNHSFINQESLTAQCCHIFARPKAGMTIDQPRAQFTHGMAMFQSGLSVSPLPLVFDHARPSLWHQAVTTLIPCRTAD